MNNEFKPLPDEAILKEIYHFLGKLRLKRTRLESDHQLNLLPWLAGNLPEDIPHMQSQIFKILDLPPDVKQLFILGRRVGIFQSPNDLNNPGTMFHSASVYG